MSILKELNEKYPIRRSDAKKSEFRDYIVKKAESLGASVRIEQTSDRKNENVIIGDPKSAKAVFTAHYDTPCASLFPNLMIPRSKGLYMAFQFIPIIIMVIVSLSVGWFAMELAHSEANVKVIVWYFSFLICYYLLFYLFYRAFVNKHNCNDNTSGVAVILSIIEKCDPETLKNAAFILFDNEEKGKKGSKAYFHDHKDEMEKKFLLNFDCVGYGENIVFVAMKEAEDMAEYAALKDSFVSSEEFGVEFYPIKGSESNSDYKNFPCGVGCMACKRTKNGILYTPRIHTARDTEAHDENIDFISSASVAFTEKL